MFEFCDLFIFLVDINMARYPDGTPYWINMARYPDGTPYWIKENV